VPTISRLLKIIGLFCRISSLLKGSFATEICDFKEPTNRSHPIWWSASKTPTLSTVLRRCVGCENIRTLPCSETHQTFAHPITKRIKNASVVNCPTQVCRVWECTYPTMQRNPSDFHPPYGVSTISRLLKIICLFCRILSLLQGSFAKGTYYLKERTNRSHPIWWSASKMPTLPTVLRSCVGCENVRTLPCSETHQTFSHHIMKRIKNANVVNCPTQVCRVWEYMYRTMQ